MWEEVPSLGFSPLPVTDCTLGPAATPPHTRLPPHCSPHPTTPPPRSAPLLPRKKRSAFPRLLDLCTLAAPTLSHTHV